MRLFRDVFPSFIPELISGVVPENLRDGIDAHLVDLVNSVSLVVPDCLYRIIALLRLHSLIKGFEGETTGITYSNHSSDVETSEFGCLLGLRCHFAFLYLVLPKFQQMTSRAGVI